MDKKIYRFALFGRTSAGKTCILTAMSLFHKRHPEGFTVTWVPDAPLPAGTPPDIVSQYEDGRCLLETSRAAILAGEAPPATKVGPVGRYRFDFTAPQGRVLFTGISDQVVAGEPSLASQAGDEPRKDPGGRKYAVEFIDYSGEMLDPRTTAAELSRKLRLQLTTMDALFVLAEAPLPGHERDRLYAEFEMLQEAFALLEAEREKTKTAIRTPVAVLFNKWDRRHSEDSTPAERVAQLEVFLNGTPEPPHRTLCDHIQGTIAEGCFRKFAVSAFGRARHETRIDPDSVAHAVELPPLGRPLPSFGLEDAFVWAARCRDEVDVSDYEDEAARVAYARLIPWFGLDALDPVHPARTFRKGTTLAARFPVKSQPRRQVRTLAGRALKIAALRAVTLACFVVASLLVTETTLDLWRFRQIRADMARPDTPEEVLAGHKSTIGSYITSHDLRHILSRLFIPRSEAQQLAAAIQDRYDEAVWAPVAALGPDAVAQEESAEEYGRKCPNGKHVSEANTIVQRARVLRKRHENTAHIDKVQSQIYSLGQREHPSLDDIMSLSSKLGDLPHPDQRLEPHEKAIAMARSEAGELLKRVAQKEKEQRLHDLLAQKQPEKAGQLAQMLVNAGGDKKKYADLMLSKVSDLIADCRNGNRWGEICSLCGQIKRGWQQLGLLDDAGIKRIADWESSAVTSQDGDNYSHLQHEKNMESCKNYLDSSVPEEKKRMRAQVKEYKKYLEKKSGSLPLKLHVMRITAGSWKAGKGDVELRLELAGLVGLSIANEWGADSVIRNEKGEPLLSQDFQEPVPLDCSAKLELDLHRTYDGTATDLGTVKWEGTISELLNKEIELPLTPAYEPAGNRTKVLIQVSGLPDEPALPPYPED